MPVNKLNPQAVDSYEFNNRQNGFPKPSSQGWSV